MIKEDDPAYQSMLQRCRDNCDEGVHNYCHQLAGTRHISLCELKGLSADEADAVRFKSPPTLGIELSPQGFMPWAGGVHLGFDAQNVALLCGQLANLRGLKGLPARNVCSSSACLGAAAIERPDELHVSLYRGRGFKDGDVAKRQFDRMKAAVRGQPFGTFGKLTVHEIAIKRKGATSYSERRVLAA